MLTVTGVSGGYGRVTVLHDVALSVEPGEIVALLGANGAGKSTLLRVIAGELRPSAGSVDFAGTELVGLRPEQVVGAGVALVPEGRRMFAGLTVRENLLLGGYGRRKVDLGPDVNRIFGLFPPLAQAFIAKPRLLMIDELSQGLAPTVVDDLIDLLPALAQEGTAVLLVEQDVESALAVASRGYVLELGSIVQEGPAAALLEDPSLTDAYLGKD